MLPSKNKFSLKTNYPLILASSSEVRKKILKKSGLRFKIIPAKLNETQIKKNLKGKPFNLICKKLAEEKSLIISKNYTDYFVIGVDQICVFEKKFLDKPLTKSKAVNQLMLLSGKEHKQITGCSLSYNGKIIQTFYKTAFLKMRSLSKRQIKDYVNYDMPLNSCGSYKFESKGYLLFSEVKGDQYIIQGIPLFSLFNLLLKKNIISYE